MEVKCPFCFKDRLPEDEDNEGLCMTKNRWKMVIHTYYHQIHFQMAVCKVEYCDFFAGLKKNLL